MGRRRVSRQQRQLAMSIRQVVGAGFFWCLLLCFIPDSFVTDLGWIETFSGLFIGIGLLCLAGRIVSPS